MSKRVVTGVLLASCCAVIGLCSSCVPQYSDSGNQSWHGDGDTTLPSVRSQRESTSTTAQPDLDSDTPEDIRRLIAELGSQKDGVRIAAARSLYKQAERATPAVPALLEHLTDDGAEVDGDVVCTVGQEATIVLAKIGEQAFEPTVQRLQDSDPEMRAAVVALLGRMEGRHTVPPLIKALQDPVAEVREAAVHALGPKHDPAALEPLMKLAGEETTEQVLVRIPSAISYLDGDNIDELISLLGLKKTVLTRAGALCLSQIHPDPRVADALLHLLRTNSAAFTPSSSFAFRQIYRSGGVEEVAEIVRSDEYSASARRWALVAMEGDPLEPELALLSFADRNSDLRLYAARRLNELRPPDTADQVFDVLNNLKGEAYFDTVRRLISYLSSTNDPRATPALIDTLFATARIERTNERVLSSLIVAVAELEDPRVVDLLLERTHGPDRVVRSTAIQTLMRIDVPRVTELFDNAANDPELPLPEDWEDLVNEINPNWLKQRQP